MGRKLDLSKLTDEEARHVWEVVQRDFDLRRREEERLEGLKGQVEKESSRKELLSDSAHLNQTHCAQCLQPYGAVGHSRRQCLDCSLFTCRPCGSTHPTARGWLCDPCHRARVVKTGSLEWYYEPVRARFKRFGSAKVVCLLSGRLQAAGGLEPASAESSGGSEQSSDDGELDVGSQAQPRVSCKKRLLTVQDLDLETNLDGPTKGTQLSPRLSCSDQPTQSSLCSLPLSSAPAATGSLQSLADGPGAEKASSQDRVVVIQEDDPGVAESQHRPGEQDSPSAGRQHTLAELCLAGHASGTALDGAATPSVIRRDEPPTQCLADTDTSDEDTVGAPHGTTSSHGEWGSQDAGSDTQKPGAGKPSDANLEEEALRRKLEVLTSHISDQSTSSEEEEEEGQDTVAGSDRSTSCRGLPGAAPKAGAASGQTKSSRDPGSQGRQGHGSPARAAVKELEELEDRVALTASQVQQAESEVSDIESRIAALQAAGLTVRPSERPRRRSNIPIFLSRLEGRTGPRVQDPNPEPPGQEVVEVTVMPHMKRKFSRPPRSPGSGAAAFDRSSVYRGSLTQRNPSGRKGAAGLVFAKPVMTHQP